MKTKKRTYNYCISTQKGGVGKKHVYSTYRKHSPLPYGLLSGLWSWLWLSPIQSVSDEGEGFENSDAEMKTLKTLAHKQFKRINKKAYPIFQSRTDLVLEEMGAYLNRSEIAPDIIFLDYLEQLIRQVF